MNRTYPFIHWLLTLVFAPFLTPLYDLLLGQYNHMIGNLVEVYPITLVFSLLFSTPALGCYYLIFYFLKRSNTSSNLTKLILISFTVLSIVVTMAIIKGSAMGEIIFAYSLTAIIVGLLTPITKKDSKVNSVL